MALSAKERKQAQLERERKALAQKTDATYPFLKTPFFEFVYKVGDWSDVEFCFESLGMDPPLFEDDRGPEAFAKDVCFSNDEDCIEAFQSSQNSIGRAEVMVDHWLDAAMELSHIINRFKQRELSNRLEELEQADLSDPNKRGEALKTAAEIAKLQEELRKNVRRTLPAWRVKYK